MFMKLYVRKKKRQVFAETHDNLFKDNCDLSIRWRRIVNNKGMRVHLS